MYVPCTFRLLADGVGSAGSETLAMDSLYSTLPKPDIWLGVSLGITGILGTGTIA